MRTAMTSQQNLKRREAAFLLGATAFRTREMQIHPLPAGLRPAPYQRSFAPLETPFIARRWAEGQTMFAPCGVAYGASHAARGLGRIRALLAPYPPSLRSVRYRSHPLQLHRGSI